MAVVVAAPWFSGGVALPVARLLYCGVVAGLFCWICGLLISPTKGRHGSVHLPVAILPLAAALALGAIQLAPIGRLINLQPRHIGSESRLQAVEPGIPHPEIRGSVDGTPGHATLSFYPAATRLSMAHLAMAAISLCLGAVLFDFGLYIPANMMLFTLLCGMVSAASCSRTNQGGAARRSLVLQSRWMVLFIVGALGISGVLGLREVSAAARAYAAVREVPPLVSPDSLEAQQTDVAIRRLTRAAAGRPDDAELRVRLAELWIYRYRLEAYRLLPQERPTAPNGAESEYWQLTGAAVLHQRANAYHRLGDVTRLEKLRSDLIVQSNLEPAIEHLVAAKRACPILPRIDLQLAALSFVRDPNSPSGEKHLRNAVHLTPGDPDVLYAAGALAGHAWLDELMYEYWRRSLDLSWRYKDVILTEARSRMELPTIINRVLPDSPQLLIELARTDYAGEQSQEERALLVARAKELVASHRSQLSEIQWHHFHAVAYQVEGRFEESIASYIRAIELDPLQIEWRFKLAKLLEQEGRIEQAYEEARLCALLAPDCKDYRSLVHELNACRLRRHSAGS